ncbi:MAG: hypothetical protein AVDCRST_MAG47-2014 [uncultured Nocardioidaceae bacterium]|uniref:DUF5130 domain-containing protein n=1 Tax=uncultured Nocardioidaceae bacterium TaxID=253824 RepID=A0A6J4N650_9ACTN|nr:MAG: hypothetical protein AVDCRST_MAG47-2014 [uncultured Nocardioidaceae bacterium]
MPAGDGFSPAQRQRIDRAIREAETVCRFEFSVYVGDAEDEPRAFAERLHGALVAPDRSVLLMVDPSQRALEVVTGAEARRELEDGEVALAVAEMQTHFAHQDLCVGIVRGIGMLAEHARKPPTLHAQES